jgi:hypothetical protein
MCIATYRWFEHMSDDVYSNYQTAAISGWDAPKIRLAELAFLTFLCMHSAYFLGG